MSLDKKVEVDKKTGCWVWLGRRDGYGRPIVDVKGKVQRVQHMNFRQQFGFSARRIYCTCRNNSCVNPDHLKDTSKKGEYRQYLIKALKDNTLPEDTKAELTTELAQLEEQMK